MPIDGRASLDEEELKQEQNPPSIAVATAYTLPYLQATKSEIHAPNFFRDASYHVRKSDKQ